MAAVEDGPSALDLWRDTWSGQSLGTEITEAQLAEIKSGELTTIGLGDYWTLTSDELGEVVYRVADYDYYYDGTSVTEHDLVLVPDIYLSHSVMKEPLYINDMGDNKAGYYGSIARATLQSTVKSALPSVLQEHLLTHNMYMSTATNSSSPYANTWELKESNGIELMSVAQVYPENYITYDSSIVGESSISSKNGYGSYSTDKQISLFKFASDGTVLDVTDYKTTKADNVNKEYSWWLSSTSGDIAYARVREPYYVSKNYGSLGNYVATGDYYLRPMIVIS